MCLVGEIVKLAELGSGLEPQYLGGCSVQTAADLRPGWAVVRPLTTAKPRLEAAEAAHGQV